MKKFISNFINDYKEKKNKIEALELENYEMQVQVQLKERREQIKYPEVTERKKAIQLAASSGVNGAHYEEIQNRFRFDVKKGEIVYSFFYEDALGTPFYIAIPVSEDEFGDEKHIILGEGEFKIIWDQDDRLSTFIDEAKIIYSDLRKILITELAKLDKENEESEKEVYEKQKIISEQNKKKEKEEMIELLFKKKLTNKKG